MNTEDMADNTVQKEIIEPITQAVHNAVQTSNALLNHTLHQILDKLTVIATSRREDMVVPDSEDEAMSRQSHIRHPTTRNHLNPQIPPINLENEAIRRYLNEYRNLTPEEQKIVGFQAYFNCLQNIQTQKKKKLEKITIQRFSIEQKSHEPRVWIQQIENYFRLMEIDSAERVSIATLHMDGIACEWWQCLERTSFRDQLPTWQEFVRLFIERFETVSNRDYYCELRRLKQIGSVEEYSTAFTRLSYVLDDIPVNRLIQLYIDGLMTEIQADVKIQEPQDLNKAIQLAKLQEGKINELKKARTRPYIPPYARSNPPSATRPSFVPNRVNRPIKPLLQRTRAEQEELRKKNLCFRCAEKWTPNHKCQKNQLYTIELSPVAEDEEIEEGNDTECDQENNEIQGYQCNEEDDTLKMSFSAMSGLTRSNTLRLRGFINAG